MDIANQHNQQQTLSMRQTFNIAGKQKSVLIAFLLTLFFGPLGLIYASVTGGIVMLLIGVAIIVIGKLLVASIMSLAYGLAIVWIACMIWGYNAAKQTIKNIETRITFRNSESILYKSLIVFLAFVITLPLIIVLIYIIKQGITQVNWHFLTHVPAPVGEAGGGISNALLGSFIMVLIASVIAIPVGMLAGIYLSENPKTKLAYYSGLCVDILQGVPSIVVGIVVYFWIVKPLGTFSALSGSVALAIMMLPIVIRSTEQTLKMLPDSLKEAALSLGVPYHRVIIKVIIPCGFAGILSGIMLSIARIIGETAPLLFTAFGNPYVSTSLTKPMESLPHLIFTYATSPYDEWHNLAWGASFMLLMFVLILNIVTKVITRKWKVQL
jgi:phosphate transport system permease protein